MNGEERGGGGARETDTGIHEWKKETTLEYFCY